jgi:indole-3-glycerol phosphate synthase
MIAEATEARVAAKKRAFPVRNLMDRAVTSRVPSDFVSSLRRPGVHIIAEIKRRSPSEGAIAPEADPVTVAGEYLRNGAAALSVLTEPDFFNGSLDFLSAIRARYPRALLLMKDFVIDEYQCAEARVHGADAVLLIASLLDDDRLGRLYAFARTLGLTPFVEVHDEVELERISRLRAELVGVNNRDLKTMKVDLKTSERLAPLAAKGTVLVSESGISNGQEVRALEALGYRGFLVGTSLMRGGRPGESLKQLLGEAK